MNILSNKMISSNDDLDNYLNCFGFFRLGDRICYKHCAIRIKCLIRKEQLLTAELYEDIMDGEIQLSVSQ